MKKIKELEIDFKIKKMKNYFVKKFYGSNIINFYL